MHTPQIEDWEEDRQKQNKVQMERENESIENAIIIKHLLQIQ